MGRNVEIKARAADFAAQRAKAGELAGGPPETLEQEDTFFGTKRGRLKLRRFSKSEGELIYYERPDAEGPSESRYMILPTREPAELMEALRRHWAFPGWCESAARSIMWRERASTWTRSRAWASS